MRLPHHLLRLAPRCIRVVIEGNLGDFSNDPISAAMATEEQVFFIDRELADLICGMSAEDILALRELQGPPESDTQIEVDIFSLTILGGKLRSADESADAMDQACIRAESWAAEPDVEEEERVRRMQILDNVVAIKLHLG